jgi:HEAT repeat protein
MGISRRSHTRSTRRAAVLAAAAAAALCATGLLFIAERSAPPALPVAPFQGSGEAASAAIGRPSGALLDPEPTSAFEGWRLGRAPLSPPGADALPGLIALVLDPRVPLAERAEAVRALALSADASAFDALERVLAAGPPLAVLAAEALGSSPDPRAVPLLVALADGAEQDVALGAVRGLARAGGAQALAALAAILGDSERSSLLRSQAARALGWLRTPEARSQLRSALAAAPDAEIVESLLEGLGAQPFAETAELFASLLASPDAPLERKLQAVEALATSSPEAGGLLLQTAATAPQPELRAGAIASLALLEGADDAAPLLLPLLGSEASPEVRAEIYDALAFLGDAGPGRADTATVLSAVLAETEPEPRLHGYRWVARRIGAGGDPSLALAFDDRMVRWLSETARDGAGGLPRRAAVDALALAATAESVSALARLAREPDPALAQAAEKAHARAERRLAARSTQERVR